MKSNGKSRPEGEIVMAFDETSLSPSTEGRLRDN